MAIKCESNNKSKPQKKTDETEHRFTFKECEDMCLVLLFVRERERERGCVYICMCARVHVCMCASVCVCMCECVCVCASVCVSKCMCVYVHRMCKRMCKQMYVRVRVRASHPWPPLRSRVTEVRKSPVTVTVQR